MKNKEPLVSIIIPTRNRPEGLQQCLAAIAGLDYPRDKFEVIVVDDGSSTQLYSVVELFSEKINLFLLKQDHAGPAAARNRGVQQAKGKFLVFTDDDCRPTPGWLAALTDFLSKKPNSMVGGEILNGLPKNLFSSASQTLVSYLYSYYTITKTLKGRTFLQRIILLCQKSVFLRLAVSITNGGSLPPRIGSFAIAGC